MSVEECIICYEGITLESGKVVTKCSHLYCVVCFAKHMRLDNKCAMCREIITTEDPIKVKETIPQPPITMPGSRPILGLFVNDPLQVNINDLYTEMLSSLYPRYEEYELGG